MDCLIKVTCTMPRQAEFILVKRAANVNEAENVVKARIAKLIEEHHPAYSYRADNYKCVAVFSGVNIVDLTDDYAILVLKKSAPET